MSEASETTAARTAGSILREARQAQGLHIAALAATIKVAQRKLEALEADRLDELPDATFTRALAQTVCRALKIDPVPVLALLPGPVGHRLEHVSEGINEPFRDHPGRRDPGEWLAVMSPGMWGALLLAVLAVVVYLLPQDWIPRLQPSAGTTPTPEPAATSTVSVIVPPVAPSASAAEGAVVQAPAAFPAPFTPQQAAVPAPAPAAPASAPPVAAAVPTGVLQLRTIAQSWVEVQDANSRVLLSRVVQPGESVVLDGAMPLRLKIGNARATEVMFRGRPLDLAASTQGNVARLELK